MTWKELQEYIETLNDYEKNLYIVLHNETGDLYYLGSDIVKDKDVSKDPCINIVQL